MENKKITGKDLITVGIYTALYVIVVFIIGAANAIPVLYPISMLIIPVVAGIPMMLYYTKIEKFGMLTISGIIIGTFFYLSGYTWICVAFLVPTALIADIILKIGGYKKYAVITLSYMIFALGMLGGPANLWFAGESYWDGIRKSMGEQYATQLAHYMPSWMLWLGIFLVLIGAFLGSILGKRMLNKHFVKAGIA
ncbi:MAG: MptD family putative ECF transporter S component [Lachnospiraceae bacterium]|nr:MptD family putative ECF transporter S component [Lachnospiraceae bacterium]